MATRLERKLNLRASRGCLGFCRHRGVVHTVNPEDDTRSESLGAELVSGGDGDKTAMNY